MTSYDIFGHRRPEPLKSLNEKTLDEAVKRAQEASVEDGKRAREAYATNREVVDSLGRKRERNASLAELLHPREKEVGDV